MPDDFVTQLAQRRARGIAGNGLSGDRTTTLPIAGDAPKADPARPNLFPPGIPLGDDDRMVGKGAPDVSQRGATSAPGGDRGLPVVQLTSIELRPAQNVVILSFSDGEDIQVPWLQLPPPEPKRSRETLPPAVHSCEIGPNGSFDLGVMKFRLKFKATDWPLNKQAAFSERRIVTCRISWPDATSAPDAGQPSGPMTGKPAITPQPAPISYPRTVDVAALEDVRLRTFIWEMLVHFDVTRRPPLKNVTRQDVLGEAQSNPTAADVVAIAVQAWGELGLTSTQDFKAYRQLTETLIEQWLYGNDTVHLNRLALRDQPQGWGLYLRESGIRYYNDQGFPDRDTYGMPLDWHYKLAKRLDINAPLAFSPDDPIHALAAAYKAGGVPSPEVIQVLAKGWLTHFDLLADEIRRKPPSGENIARQLGDQMLPLASFLGLEGLAAFFKTLPQPFPEVGIGLQGLLKFTAYYFQVSLAVDAYKVAVEIGGELYRVKREKDGSIDTTSRQHLENAGDRTRTLLEAAAVLFAQILAGKAAQDIAAAVPSGGGPAAPGFSILVTPDRQRVFNFGTASKPFTPPILLMASIKGEKEKKKAAEKGKAASASGGKSPAPVNKSRVPDTDPGLTEQQRKDIRSGDELTARTVTVETEERVGKKLVKATGLPLERPDSPSAKQLSAKPPEGKPIPPIAKVALVEAPEIKAPEAKSVRGKLGSWIPDFLLMGPGWFEVFEVTVDTYMNLTRQLKGMVRGKKWSFSHKIEQLAKSEVLIKRYPDANIVYNIQTFGALDQSFFEEKLKDVIADLTKARQDAKATGSFQVVIRGDNTVVIDVP